MTEQEIKQYILDHSEYGDKYAVLDEWISICDFTDMTLDDILNSWDGAYL